MNAIKIIVIAYFIIGLWPLITAIIQIKGFKDLFKEMPLGTIFGLLWSLLIWPFVFFDAIVKSIKSLF